MAFYFYTIIRTLSIFLPFVEKMFVDHFRTSSCTINIATGIAKVIPIEASWLVEIAK